MPRFAANLTMMFTELPFLERFQAAADAGFTAVEYLFPYDHDAGTVAQTLRGAGLRQVLFNAPAGDWDAGERGLASLEGRDEDFAGSIETALRYAAALDCPQIHVMAGVPGGDMRVAEELYVSRIRQAADEAARAGRTVLVEPINSRDMPGYFLGSVRQARPLLEAVGRDNVGLQLDLYHAQITEGDLTRLIQETAEITRHIQIASVPDRNEPDTGELDYGYLFEVLDRSGYEGWVGCEYRPAGATLDGLGWFAPYAAPRPGDGGVPR